jgi:hypothetical protein
MIDNLSLVGLGFLGLGALLLIGFTFLARNGFKPPMRSLSAYDMLARQVGQAVESGGRVHVSLGPGSIIGEETGTVLAGIGILESVSESSSVSDTSPVATTGDATTLPVMGDAIIRSYRNKDVLDRYETTSARLVSLDPISMAGGTTSVIIDDNVQANVLVGSFGEEMALIAETGQRRRIPQVAGSDKLSGQAVAYAMTDHSLIGEELYVARAYLSQEPVGIASLAVQDILRWMIIISIVVGSILGAFGVIR